MAKNSKDKKGSSANKNRFKAEDKVYAMDGGDLYEAKVSFFLKLFSRCVPFALHVARAFPTAAHELTGFMLAV